MKRTKDLFGQTNKNDVMFKSGCVEFLGEDLCKFIIQIKVQEKISLNHYKNNGLISK